MPVSGSYSTNESQNRQNSQSGTQMNSAFLNAMNQYTGGRQNPFTFMQPATSYYGPNQNVPEQRPWQQQYQNPYGAGPQQSHQMGWNPYTYAQNQTDQQAPEQWYQEGAGQQTFAGHAPLNNAARNPYRVNWGQFTSAHGAADPGKQQDIDSFLTHAREEAAKRGVQFDPENMSYEEFNYLLDNMDEIRPGFSGRSGGAFEAARGQISSHRRLIEDYGPNSGEPLDPTTQFGASMPDRVRQAYNDGTATGLSWDGHRWVESAGNPDLVHDGETNRFFYRGQEVSAEEMAMIQEHGPQGAPVEPEPDRFNFETGQPQDAMQSEYEQRAMQSEYERRNMQSEYQPRDMQSQYQQRDIDAPQVDAGKDPRYDSTMDKVLSEDERMFMNAEQFKDFVQTPDAQLPGMDRRGIQVDPSQVAGPSLINMESGKDLRDSIYKEMTAVPMEQFQRRAEVQKEQFMSRLAQAGLADSKAGAEQLFRDVYEPILSQEGALMQQASATATRLSKDYDLQVAMANQKAKQETNLANAGFKQEARINTARNFLTSNISEYENNVRGVMQTQNLQQQSQIANMQQYAQALNINVDSVFQMRDQFMSALGLMQQDRALDNQMGQQNADRTMLGQQLGIQQDQMSMDDRFRYNQLNVQQDQFGADDRFRYGQMGVQQDQFGADDRFRYGQMDVQQDQMAMDDRFRYGQMGSDDRFRYDQLGLQGQQATAQANIQAEQLALDRIRQMSEHDRQIMSIAFEAYIAEQSAMINAGRFTTQVGRQSSSQSDTSVGIS